ncbi:MAG: hypothetical protein HAW66_02670, partial [Shewanella sp.]|nr:hypothetical protein [Shewanella sp.]
MKSYGIVLALSILISPIAIQAAVTVETDQTAKIIAASKQSHGFMDWVYDA